ncbi:MAG: ABC transporter permease [Bdellovibrionales bacterium]|nr:ABC transporter permease [Bdellovibrionales bacterium]
MFKLAWRNIWRHPRRTMLTLLAIAFAAAVLVFFIGLQLSSYDATINATISVFNGAIQVQPEGYHDRPQMRLTIDRPQQVLSSISEIPGVVAAAPRAIGFALLSSGSRTYGAQVVGVDPSTEPKVSTIPGLIKEGRYFTSTDETSFIVGTDLAKNLHVSVGDELTLLGQGRDGSMAATVLPIVGIFSSGSEELDRMMVQLPLHAFADTFGMNGSIHVVAVAVKQVGDVEPVEREIERSGVLGDSLVALRWDELIPGIRQMIELDMSSGWFFYFTLILIVAFSVVNTFFMAVLERTREFCVMLSLGMRPGYLCRLVVLESVMLLVSGLLLGIFIGSLIVLYFGEVGFSVPGMEEMARQFNMPGSIYPRVSFRALTDGPSVIFATSLIGVLFPAARVWRLNPTEGIRQV